MLKRGWYQLIAISFAIYSIRIIIIDISRHGLHTKCFQLNIQFFNRTFFFLQMRENSVEIMLVWAHEKLMSWTIRITLHRGKSAQNWRICKENSTVCGAHFAAASVEIGRGCGWPLSGCYRYQPCCFNDGNTRPLCKAIITLSLRHFI
jgi:hypothetical protein